MKNMVQVLGLLSLFLLARAANAAVLFSEVQIAPPENRFIEIYNNGSDTVDLTGYYIQRKTQTGTSFSSLITSTNFAGKQINAGEYFVISRSNVANADIVLSGMTLTESNTIQLKNSDGEVVDKLCWGNAGDCDGAKLATNPTEGKSISLVNDAFSETNPTLGSANTNTDNTSTDNNTNNITESADTENTAIDTSGTVSESSLKLVYTEPVFAKIPVLFNLTGFGSAGDKYIYGKYIWNFGDGVSFESRASETNDISHTYSYPGDYVLTLEYYGGDYALAPSVTLRKNLVVLPVSVVISKVGNQEEFFVELTNQTKSEVNIFGWKLVYGNEFFIFPKNSFLLAGKKVTFSPAITNFHFNNVDSVILYNKNSDPVFDSALLNPKKVTNTTNQKIHLSNVTSDSKTAKNAESIVDLTKNNSESKHIELNNRLTASAYGGVGKYTLPILLLLLCGGAGVVYFVRKSYKNEVTKTDFEILDE